MFTLIVSIIFVSSKLPITVGKFPVYDEVTRAADAVNFTFYFDTAAAKQTTQPETCDNYTQTAYCGLQMSYCGDIRPESTLFNTTYLALLIIAGSSVVLLTISGNFDEEVNVSGAVAADMDWETIRSNFEICTEVLSYSDADIENNTVNEAEVHEFDWDQLSEVAKKCHTVRQLEDKVTSVDITKKLDIDPVRNIGYFGHCDDACNALSKCTDALLQSYLNDDYNVDSKGNRYFVLKPAAMAGGDLTYFFKYDPELNKYQFEDNYLLDYLVKGMHANSDKYNREISLTAEEQRFKDGILQFHDFESLKNMIDGNQSMAVLHELGQNAGKLMQEKKYSEARNAIKLADDGISGCFLKYICLAATRYVSSGLRYDPSRNECLIVQPRFMAKPFGEDVDDEIYKTNNDKPFEINVLSIYGKTIAAQWNVPIYFRGWRNKNGLNRERFQGPLGITAFLAENKWEVHFLHETPRKEESWILLDGYDGNESKRFEEETHCPQSFIARKEDYKSLVKELLPELARKTDILAKYSKFPMWRSDYFVGKVDGEVIVKYNEGESLSGKEFLKFEGNRSICLDREITSNVKKGILQFQKR